MPKHKIARKSTMVDMTAMCDVSFLLLTFFMLATKFKPPEVVTVVTPASISDTKIPETDMMLITVDKDGRVFFDMDGQPTRKALIEEINEDQNLGLSENEMNNFVISQSIGVPFNQLKSLLQIPPANQKDFKSTGIPVDTTLGETNQLFKWVAYGRIVNQNARIAIKGDNDVKYPVVNSVFSTLANDKVQGYKFNLVTNMKGSDGEDEEEGGETN